MYIFDGLLLFITWERPLKSQNNANFIKEQEKFTNWTIDGAQHQKMKAYELGIKVFFSWTQRIQNISKNQNLSSPEQNYFAFLAIRYPTTEELNRTNMYKDYSWYVGSGVMFYMYEWLIIVNYY